MARRPRRHGRQVNGVLILDKPKGMSSNAALQQVKNLFQANKAGHTGSLDPLASGLLPICFGEATKFSQYLLDADKHYQTSAQLGARTTTGDAEGEILAKYPTEHICPQHLARVIKEFHGAIEQVPSMYSALKHKGQPLYKLARQGIEVDRPPRTVHIHQLTLLGFQADQLALDVRCSKGTYIRNLVEDIAMALDSGAYVTELRRLASGPYEAGQMVTLDNLTALATSAGCEALDTLLLPSHSALGHYPALSLTEAVAYYLRQGQAVRVPNAPEEGLVRLFLKNNAFLGLGEVMDDGRIKPKRLLSQ